jgi:hypothetical protein
LFRLAKDTIPLDLLYKSYMVGVIHGEYMSIEKDKFAGRKGKIKLSDLEVPDGSRVIILRPIVDTRFENIEDDNTDDGDVVIHENISPQ